MGEADRFTVEAMVGVGALVVSVFFSLMVGSLVVMHAYLIVKNLTTWEYLSWQRISYMKVWPKKYGSPFT